MGGAACTRPRRRGDSTLAEQARRAEDTDASVLAVVESGHAQASAVGKAIEQLDHASGHVKAPIVACNDATPASGHAATVVDRSVHVYLLALSAERHVQSRWIAGRLGLSA